MSTTGQILCYRQRRSLVLEHRDLPPIRDHTRQCGQTLDRRLFRRSRRSRRSRRLCPRDWLSAALSASWWLLATKMSAPAWWAFSCWVFLLGTKLGSWSALWSALWSVRWFLRRQNPRDLPATNMWAGLAPSSGSWSRVAAIELRWAQ
jgi:hypothetical protein